ncbi:MAG: DUF1501 domain-containing protein [Planctomycetes bacterium]|nr:DUF1501 domain-containing protein [Planctomycetota bacterium]
MGCITRQHVSSAEPLGVMTRRGVIHLSLGAALGAVLGPTLPRVFGGESKTQPARPLAANEKSVILLWLKGGPFQHDSFDPKPLGNDKLGLKFGPLATSADGVQLASCMPQLAKQAHHLTLIRSMKGLEMEHNLASYFMQTGYRATGPIQSPAIGSIVSHELGSVPMRRAEPDGIPPFISIGSAGFSAGHFGPAYRPYLIWDPTRGAENLGLPSGISASDHARRLQWLKSLEEGRTISKVSREIDSGRASALSFMGSKQRAAFDLTDEPAELRERYGKDDQFGQGCLLARRLVAAGARFVQVELGNFDQHEHHYPTHEKLMNRLDRSMAALVDDLHMRGLLDNTIVMAVGEFGRTPRLSGKAGRDHFINGFSAALAGGGFKRGYVHGATSADGQEIRDNPVTVPDLLATLCHDLGIDPEKEFTDQFDRPIKLVDHGKVVREVLSSTT